MFLIFKYIVLIILPYKCIYGIQPRSYDEYKPGGHHCVILFPMENEYFMPIPYQRNISGPAVINPDHTGYLFIANDNYFQFSCSGSTFESPASCEGLTEVTVKCSKGNKVSFKGKKFEFDDFRCKATPTATLTAANAPCNGILNGVFNMGFDTLVPLNVYKVCFDARIKRTLYSWHYVNAPIWHSVQVSETLPHFVKTEHFKSVDMVKVYDLKAQNNSKSLQGSSMEVNRILVNNVGHTLVPGLLLTIYEFPYAFQHLATHYYENTAPQWSEFRKGVWREVEKLVLHNLSKASGKHLIVAGTINATHLFPSETNAQKHFVLQPPDSIPVPECIWRMVYDVQNKTGVVFIGMNTPFFRGDSSKHFCEKMTCPGDFGVEIAKTNMVYCCSKESFEKSYGPLDTIVFKEF